MLKTQEPWYHKNLGRKLSFQYNTNCISNTAEVSLPNMIIKNTDLAMLSYINESIQEKHVINSVQLPLGKAAIQLGFTLWSYQLLISTVCSFIYYWSTVDLWCCVKFCDTAKWLSSAYTFFFIFFSIMLYHWILTFPVLCSRTLFILSMYTSLHLLIPNPILPSSTPNCLFFIVEPHIAPAFEHFKYYLCLMVCPLSPLSTWDYKALDQQKLYLITEES